MEKFNKILKKCMSVLFTLIVLGVFGFFLIAEIVLPNERKTVTEAEYELYSGDWNRIMSDGTAYHINLKDDMDISKEKKIVIENTLNISEKYDTWMTFNTTKHDVKVYVDGQLRKEYSTKDSRAFGGNSPSVYLSVRLCPEDNGKIIRIEYDSDNNYTERLDDIYIGTQNGAIAFVVGRDWKEIMIASILFLLGLFCVVTSVILAFVYKKRLALEYLGWGVMMVAGWVMGESSTRQYIFPNHSTAAMMTYLCLFTVPIAFLMYINTLQEDRYGLFYSIMEPVSIIYMIYSVVRAASGRCELQEMLNGAFLIILLSMVLILVTMAIEMAKGFVKRYILEFIGLLGGVTAGFIQVLIYFSKPSDMDGRVICMGLLFLIVMELIKTVGEIMRMEAEKTKAISENEAKARFLANMSHEIRTPINAVLGMDKMIIRETTEENIREYAKDIQTAGRSLLSIINDILDMSKIESGKLELVESEYDLLSIINDCNSMISIKAQEKGLKLSVNNNSIIPSRYYGDEVRIKQIIINLMTNAVKYTKEGWVSITFSGQNISEDMFMLEVCVKDSGIGIKKENISEIFDSFSRSDEKNNRWIEGTGLGLSITKQLVDMMGGTIEVESEFGKGSEFRVSIPQKIISNEPIGVYNGNYEQRKSDENESQVLFTAQGRVLVVDDVAMNLKVFKGLLKNTGLTIDTAESGMECLKLMQQNIYDVIFLDHMMPEMDGIETLEKTKTLENNKNTDTPIVMLTANAVVGAKEQYMSLGFSEYLTKPIKENDLRKALLHYLSPELIEKKQENK